MSSNVGAHSRCVSLSQTKSLGTADSLGQTKLTNWIWEIYGNMKNCKNNWKNWTKLGKKGEKKIRPERFWVFAQSRGICEFSVPIFGPGSRDWVVVSHHGFQLQDIKVEQPKLLNTMVLGMFRATGSLYLVMLMPSFSRYLQTALKRQALAI